MEKVGRGKARNGKMMESEAWLVAYHSRPPRPTSSRLSAEVKWDFFFLTKSIDFPLVIHHIFHQPGTCRIFFFIFSPILFFLLSLALSHSINNLKEVSIPLWWTQIMSNVLTYLKIKSLWNQPTMNENESSSLQRKCTETAHFEMIKKIYNAITYLPVSKILDYMNN